MVGVVPTQASRTSRDRAERRLCQESIGTRLTSRHFRSQLFHLDAEGSTSSIDEFFNLLLPYTPELTAMALKDSYRAGAHDLDNLYVVEAATHSEKEVFWLGDGLQVWLRCFCMSGSIGERTVSSSMSRTCSFIPIYSDGSFHYWTS